MWRCTHTCWPTVSCHWQGQLATAQATDRCVLTVSLSPEYSAHQEIALCLSSEYTRTRHLSPTLVVATESGEGAWRLSLCRALCQRHGEASSVRPTPPTVPLSRFRLERGWGGRGVQPGQQPPLRAPCLAVSFPLYRPQDMEARHCRCVQAQGASLGTCPWGSCRTQLPLESSVMLLRPSAHSAHGVLDVISCHRPAVLGSPPLTGQCVLATWPCGSTNVESSHVDPVQAGGSQQAQGGPVPRPQASPHTPPAPPLACSPSFVGSPRSPGPGIIAGTAVTCWRLATGKHTQKSPAGGGEGAQRGRLQGLVTGGDLDAGGRPRGPCTGSSGCNGGG